MVDQQVEVSLRGDMIGVHTLTGADARDNGSECSAPLPGRMVDGFTMTVKKRHGEVRLVAEPAARNDFTATIFIHDNAAGEGLYDCVLVECRFGDAARHKLEQCDTVRRPRGGQGGVERSGAGSIGAVTVVIGPAAVTSR